MGIEYIRHSDLCGCERCAIQADNENPRAVYDEIDNPEIMDCGCSVWGRCDCASWDID